LFDRSLFGLCGLHASVEIGRDRIVQVIPDLGQETFLCLARAGQTGRHIP
jgi:hypothetical protein